jgi:8-oxo-dGTP diphosphatase
VPGGAIDAHEDPVEAALREFDEEIGAVPSGWRLAGIHEVVVQPGLWSYHTCCAYVDERPHYDATLSPENDEAAWWSLDELNDLPLFNPFAEALPSLLEILRRPA